MKAGIFVGLLVLGAGWWALSGLDKRKNELAREVGRLETPRSSSREIEGNSVTGSRRAGVTEAREAARKKGDFFATFRMLEGLDRDELRDLAREVMALENDRSDPMDAAMRLAGDAILAAVARTDSLWFLMEEGRNQDFRVAAFRNLITRSPEDALQYYESLGEERYDYPGAKGDSNRFYQMVLTHLAPRDAGAAVKHLFAMDVRIRNLSPPVMWRFQSMESAKAMWDELERHEGDRYNRREMAMGIVAAKIYKAGGIAGIREVWKEVRTMKDRQAFLRESGFMRIFQSEEGARNLQRLLAEGSERERRGTLANFASGWAYLDRPGVEKWAKSLPSGTLRDQVANSLLGAFRQVDDHPKKGLVELIGDEEIRSRWEEEMTR